MKNIKIITVVSLLLVFNVLLVYANLERQKAIDFLSSQSIIESNPQIIHPGITLTDSGLGLVVLFTDQSCPDCLKFEVPNLNEFYSENNTDFHVYIIGSNETLLERYQASFPYTHISPDEAVLDMEFEIVNPVAMVVDSEGMVQHIYESKIGEPEKSVRFYQRMRSLFRSFNKVLADRENEQ